jgi:hypothetical protein
MCEARGEWISPRCNDLGTIYGAETKPTHASWHYSGGNPLGFESGVELEGSSEPW